MIFIAQKCIHTLMFEYCSVIGKTPFILRDNNGEPMDFEAEVLCRRENSDDLFLWIKSTRNDDAFNIIKFRLKELFEKHKIEPNIFIFKNPQYNGSNGKYFPFEIKKEYQVNLDKIEKYNKKNYNSFFMYLPFFNIMDLLSIEFPFSLDKNNKEISNGENLRNSDINAIEKNHSFLLTIMGMASILFGGYFLYRYLKKK